MNETPYPEGFIDALRLKRAYDVASGDDSALNEYLNRCGIRTSESREVINVETEQPS